MQNTIQLAIARWGDSMITPEEREEIINAAVEKAILSLPTVMGSLMAQQAMYSKLNSAFYKDYPDFAKHKDVVASTIEQVDGQNPLLAYEEKLAKAVPLIEQKIKTLGTLDMKGVDPKPRRTFDGPLEAVRPTNHGDI